jgi:ubiquinone/menaquinone biosynthesis C-methylase UbiE
LANNYQNHSNLQWNWAIERLKKISFNSTDKVLDVGCGDGKITAFIAKQISNGIVIGLDISKEMLMYASSHYPFNNLLFFEGNASSIPFKQQFDKIVCFSTLHWILDQEKALRSFKESLKPEGVLLLVLPGKAPSNLGDVSQKIASSEKWSQYFINFESKRVYYDPKEYQLLLEKIELQIQSLEITETITEYKDKASLIANVKPLVNFIDCLPKRLHEEFINDIVDEQIRGSDLSYSDNTFGILTSKIEVIAINRS